MLFNKTLSYLTLPMPEVQQKLPSIIATYCMYWKQTKDLLKPGLTHGLLNGIASALGEASPSQLQDIVKRTLEITNKSATYLDLFQMALEMEHEGFVHILDKSREVHTQIDWQDGDVMKKLVQAARNEHKTALDPIIHLEDVDLEWCDHNKRTLLSYSAENGHVAGVNQLLATESSH